MDKIDTSHQNRIVNHCRIHQLLTRAAERLHQIFRNRWVIYSNLSQKQGWEDGEKCGAILLQFCATSVAPQMKEKLKNGKVDLWDVTMATLAIQAISKAIRNYGAETNKEEDKYINELKELRNTIAHIGKSELSDDEFSMYWSQLKDILIKLGDSPFDIEELKKKVMEIGQSKIEVNSEDAKKEVVKLKEEANNLFKAQKFDEAIQVYTKILDIPGTLPENQAVIFSNRSAAYLKLKTENSLKMAQRDADWAVQLWPCWWRGYYRLALAQKELGGWKNLENAAESLNKALALNPTSKEVRDELSALRTQIGVISREEHLIPSQQPRSIEEEFKEASIRMGLNEKQFKNILKLAQDTPMLDNVIKGHQYRDGIGVQQDYTKAAGYYAKAAIDGNPEGMYNLGRLYHHGKGVKHDYEQSMHWLTKAATSSSMGPMIGSGIPEAQHLLGLKYADGIGVTQDYRKAAEWYEKAAMNGLGAAANNLGLLYKNGTGVERSPKKAFHHFKLAAQRGDTPGMQNLAECYFCAEGTGSITPTEEDIVEGMKWLRIAAEKGDLKAAMELERRENLSSEELKLESLTKLLDSGMVGKANPLDQEQYSKYIKSAAKKGSLTAKRVLDIWRYMNIAMDAFKKSDCAGLIAALSEAIRLDHEIVEVPELFKSIIEERIKTHPNELDTTICFVRLNTKNPAFPIFIDKYLQKFPDDNYLLEMRIACFITLQQMKEALKAADMALKLHPKSLRFLYTRAVTLALQDKQTKESIKACDAFLAAAPEDHDKVPAIHYRKAMYYLGISNNNENFIRSFEAGLASEKKQLPCFLPYNFSNKNLLEKVYMVQKSEFGSKKQVEIPTVTTSFNRNLDQIRFCPQRKRLLTLHRKTFIVCEDTYSKTVAQMTIQKVPNSPKPPSLVSLKKITLKDMDPTKDKVYNGYVLEVRIIDWPLLMTGIVTIIEDENGDVERMAIYNWPKADNILEIMRTFRPNCMMSIINPYMRMARDFQSVIRVESPAYIRLDDSLCEKRCYCCGKEAETMKCAKCRMARYCSKECQKLDWTEFNHKDVCKHLKKYSNVL